MKIKVSGIIKYVLLIISVILIYILFYPRTYNVPQMKDREGTLYWDLPTGSRIAYTLIAAKGIKKPFPIIFLQGGPGGFITDRNIAVLEPLSENGYDIYLYDQVGSGHSARLENINEYTAERHKKDLEEIVKLTGKPKVILIGQSWGAILATLFIADNPEKVQKVIFTGPGPIQPVNQNVINLVAPDSLNLKTPVFSNALAAKKVKNLRSMLIENWAKHFGRKLASDKEADDFQTYLNNELNKSTVCDTTATLKAEGGGGYYSSIMTTKSMAYSKDPRSFLIQSGIPALVMKGQCDNQRWGFTNEYLQLFINHKFVVIPNAGHSISVEQPYLYIETIREFLND